MSFPKLNLKKYYCKRFEIYMSAFLDNKTYSEMLDAGIFQRLKRGEIGIFTKNYKINRAEYTVICLVQLPKRSKAKKVEIKNRFSYYQSGTVEVTSEPPFKVSFAKLCSFFKKPSIDCRVRAVSGFVFPTDKFKPIMELPYTATGLLGERKIEIFGLRIIAESKGQKYRQSISVGEKSISQSVVMQNLEETLSASLMKSKLEESFAYAQELIRKKGRKGAVSK